VTALTIDNFFGGRIRVRQNRKGYRFSIDAVLLADCAGPRVRDKILDLGTGCGIIALILAYRHPQITVNAVELQPELADLAAANVRDNRLEDRISVLNTDFKLLTPTLTAGPVDLVVCNPPYRKPGSGRVNPDDQRAVARHELKAGVVDVVQTARRMLRTAGRFVTVYPAERVTDMLCQMRANNVEPKWMRTIQSSLPSAAKLVLIEGVKGAGPGLVIAPALILYNDRGEYTAEVNRMFEP